MILLLAAARAFVPLRAPICPRRQPPLSVPVMSDQEPRAETVDEGVSASDGASSRAMSAAKVEDALLGEPQTQPCRA